MLRINWNEVDKQEIAKSVLLLDLFAKIEYSHFANNTADIEQFTNKAENIIDVACDYMKAGFYEDALYALDFYKDETPLVEYYKAFCKNDISLI